MTAHERLEATLATLSPKPDDSAKRPAKKRYSEQMSEIVAQVIANELRELGMKEARPALPGQVGASGAERRIAGGIGAKKVDVTWATEESGLLLALSVKTTNFKDKSSQNYQKNLTNRRGEMLFETVTLHRRFPYAVIGGLYILDAGAGEDGTARRESTFLNAHTAFKLFTNRLDPGDREEKFEAFYLALQRSTPFKSEIQLYHAGEPEKASTLDDMLKRLLELVVERNSDLYQLLDGRMVKK